MPFMKTTLLLVLLCNLSLTALRAQPGDSIKTVKLFDFSQPSFVDGADKKRSDWEKDFIAFGRTTETTAPQNYVKHLIKRFALDGTVDNDLYIYRYNYSYGSGRYSYENFADGDQMLWADKTETREGYLFHHISRDPENLRFLWSIFDNLVEAALEPYLRKGARERYYIEILTETWECISSKKNYAKKLDALYLKILDQGVYAILEHSKGIECQTLNSKLSLSSGQSLEYEKDWIYSFWIRRHHEGNAEATYEILTSLLN